MLHSGLTESWWADSMECYTYLRNVTDLLSDGKTPYERRFGQPLRTDHSVWFTGWVLPYLCERPVKNPSIWKESVTWIVPRIRSVRGGNLEGWRTDCRPWGVGDDGRIGNLLKKTQCERGDISQRKRIYFPVADGRIKPLGGDQDLRTSTTMRQRPVQGENHLYFLGESEGSLPPPPDSFPNASEAINDLWSMSRNFIHRHHVEPRVKLYSPREETFLFHWNPLMYPELPIRIWMSNKRNASMMIIGISMGQEICLIHGQVSLNLLYWKKYLQTEKWCPGEINEKNSWHPGQITNGQNSWRKWERMPSWRRGKSGHMKNLNLIMLENCEDLFHWPRGQEFKETIKNAREKLETPIAPAMPYKILKKTYGSGTSNKIKSKMGEPLPASSWRPYCRKRKQFTTAWKYGSQIYSYASSYENSRSKGSSGQGMGKMEKISAWILTKVKSKKEVIDEARTKGAKVHFASLMDICHLKNAELEAKHQK